MKDQDKTASFLKRQTKMFFRKYMREYNTKDISHKITIMFSLEWAVDALCPRDT